MLPLPMTRSDMRALPVLASKERELTLCVYCPKLCRAACPVSNAEPREALIPWGKMSTAYFLARGDVPIDEDHAATAWACTGCMACRERCDHHNDVATTLGTARAALFEKGVAPEAAKKVAADFPKHVEETARANRELAARNAAHVSDAGTPFVVGCGYARELPDEADAWLVATAKLLGGPVKPLSSCCGMPAYMAGDVAAGNAAQAALLAEVGAAERVVVADPGCAFALRERLGDRLVLAIDLAADALPRLAPSGARDVVYHDPCKLGRGLGRYEQPRAILSRILGHAPGEMDERRSMAACSGAGGLLPVTMPETSRAIAKARVDAAGGRAIVTACASSLRAFRAAGASAEDLGAWIAKSLP